MSRSPNADIPGFDLPPANAPRPVRRRRHALGLPAGSIRALLTCVVFGLLAALLLTNKQAEVPLLYNYLWSLLLLIVAHYFASHGNTIGHPEAAGAHPWGLPRGTFRFLLIAGFIGLIAWLFYNHQPFFEEVPQTSAAIPFVLLAGFFLGVCVARLVGWATRGEGPPAWFQDLQAWVALIALLLLAGQVIILVFINPTVAPENQILQSGHLEGAFAAVVGFYFGARS